MLCETCKPPDISPDRYFIGADLNLYYDTQHTRWYKRTDWFLVLGVALVTQQSDLRLFKLVATRYEEIQLTDRRHWFDELNLGLGVYPSVYNGVEVMWLRWTDKTGQLVLNDSESLFQERNRADRLAAKLSALGIDPESDLEQFTLPKLGKG